MKKKATPYIPVQFRLGQLNASSPLAAKFNREGNTNTPFGLSGRPGKSSGCLLKVEGWSQACLPEARPGALDIIRAATNSPFGANALRTRSFDDVPCSRSK